LSRPSIGVSVVRRDARSYREYLQRIVEAGGIAIEITPEDSVSQIIGSLDGVLLPGGGDVEPSLYHAVSHPKTDGVRADLDALELALIAEARERELPLLAICRGHQLANVAFGGSLQQHIDAESHRTPTADPPAQWPSAWHNVRIEAPSRLAGLLGTGEIMVNSRHHQGVTAERLAPDLVAVAVSPDGFVEAAETADGSWLMSVQWHPERSEVIESFRPLFSGLIRAAQERRLAAQPQV
jgi:putative glutamine amidotransferase